TRRSSDEGWPTAWSHETMKARDGSITPRFEGLVTEARRQLRAVDTSRALTYSIPVHDGESSRGCTLRRRPRGGRPAERAHRPRPLARPPEREDCHRGAWCAHRRRAHVVVPRTRRAGGEPSLGGAARGRALERLRRALPRPLANAEERLRQHQQRARG